MRFFKLRFICANYIRLHSPFSQSALSTQTHNQFGLNFLDSVLLSPVSSPWEFQSKCNVGLILSAVLTAGVIMSPKTGIYEWNFDLTKHHSMRSPSRRRNIKYVSLRSSPGRLMLFFSDFRLMKLNVHRSQNNLGMSEQWGL